MSNIVMKITFEDFEAVLDRKLSQEEKDIIYNKFEIYDLNETIECFLECRDIR